MKEAAEKLNGLLTPLIQHYTNFYKISLIVWKKKRKKKVFLPLSFIKLFFKKDYDTYKRKELR